jgi:hypothetical protein
MGYHWLANSGIKFKERLRFVFGLHLPCCTSEADDTIARGGVELPPFFIITPLLGRPGTVVEGSHALTYSLPMPDILVKFPVELCNLLHDVSVIFLHLPYFPSKFTVLPSYRGIPGYDDYTGACR